VIVTVADCPCGGQAEVRVEYEVRPGQAASSTAPAIPADVVGWAVEPGVCPDCGEEVTQDDATASAMALYHHKQYTGEHPMDRILLDQVRLVAQQRRHVAALANVVKVKQDAFTASNADELAQLTIGKQVLEVAERALRECALAVVKETGDTHPAPGVSVRQTTTVHVTDTAAAFAWAKQTGFCLALDGKSLTALAKSGGMQLQFVSITVEPAITLASDLDAALGVSELASGVEA